MKQVTMESVKHRIADLERADNTFGLGLNTEFELSCLRELVAVTEHSERVSKSLETALGVQADQAKRTNQLLGEIKKAEAVIGSLGWMGLDTAISLELTKLNKQISDLQGQVSLLTEQRDALVVENSKARERHIFIRALAVSILEHSGGRMDWRGAMEDASELIKTVDEVYASIPATSSAIAAMRAEGIEQWISSRNGAWNGTTKQAEEFARQLRESKGAQS